MQITWYGHSAFRLDFGGKAVLIDPFFTGNPAFVVGQGRGDQGRAATSCSPTATAITSATRSTSPSRTARR